MARAKKVSKENKEDTERDDSEDLKGGPGKYSRKLASFWDKSIKDSIEVNAKWYDRGDAIITRFRDDRKKSEQDALRRLNVLWSNFKILKPALYGRVPQPVCERRYLQHDPVGRTSAIILQRNTKFQIEINGFHTSIGRAVSDYLLPGRGTVWVRYEPEIGQGDSIPVQSQSGVEDGIDEIEKEFNDTEGEEAPETEKLESTGEQLLSEQAPVDYVAWKDFITMPARARTWDEVQAIAKRVYISKKEAKERFGDEIGGELRPDTTVNNSKAERATTSDTSIFHDLNERSIIIYEIWNKTDRKIYWISSGYEYLCDIKEDFLKLKKFFPVPEPISSTLTNDSLIPVPDYTEYEDQALQIDETTQRLALLTKACKLVGTYDASNGPLKRLLEDGVENELLPVDSWAVFAEKGGVKGGISFLPIDEIQKVIDTLTKVRQSLMQDLDLISGITDVQRGTTDSRETLGGLRLKNNNTGTRLSDRQNEVARFARDTVAIVAEIAAKHFADKTLIEASGILLDDDLQPKTILEDLMDQLADQKPPNPMMGHNGGPPMGALPGGMPPPPIGGPQPPQMLGAVGGPPTPPPGQMPMMGPPGAMQGMPALAPPMGAGMPGPMLPPSPMAPPPPMGGLMGMGPPPPPNPMMLIQERVQKSIDLLRKDVPLGYRIEIETDSTIFADAAQERKDATEFITASTQFLGQAAELAQTMPEAVPLFGRMLQWGVRKFRVGRDLEGAIDRFVEKMDKKVKQIARNPQKNPEQIKAEAEQKSNEMKLQQIAAQGEAAKQKTQMEQQAQAANDARDFQKQQQEDARDAEISKMEIANKQQESQMLIAQKQREMDMQMAMKEREHQINMEALERQAIFDQQAHEHKLEQLKLQAQEKAKARAEKAKQPKKASK